MYRVSPLSENINTKLCEIFGVTYRSSLKGTIQFKDKENWLLSMAYLRPTKFIAFQRISNKNIFSDIFVPFFHINIVCSDGFMYNKYTLRSRLNYNTTFYNLNDYINNIDKNSEAIPIITRYFSSVESKLNKKKSLKRLKSRF